MSADTTIDGETESRMASVPRPIPRLGFVGLGGTGRTRLRGMIAAGVAEAAALCDSDPGPLGDAAGDHRKADCFDDPLELLEEAGRLRLDGLVISTPAHSQAELAVAALRRGLAVLCRTPLGASADQCRQVIAEARKADRSLEVDYPFRGVSGVARALSRVREGLLGRVLHVHGVFHRAESLRGGLGAFEDLGVHLLDLTHGLLGRPAVERVVARCYREGRPLAPPVREAEDLATVRLEFAGSEVSGGASADLTASRGAHAGSERILRLEVFGSRGGLELVGVDGSACELELAVREGARRTVVARGDEADLAAPAIGWARRLARGARFTAEAANGAVALAETLDRIYGRATRPVELDARRTPRTAAPDTDALRASA